MKETINPIDPIDIVNVLEKLVRGMRENGENDLRSVLYSLSYIRTAIELDTPREKFLEEFD